MTSTLWRKRSGAGLAGRDLAPGLGKAADREAAPGQCVAEPVPATALVGDELGQR
ncbi:hypothetical protein [Thermaurantiacus sp.]